jgi:hypothetical protein
VVRNPKVPSNPKPPNHPSIFCGPSVALGESSAEARGVVPYLRAGAMISSGSLVPRNKRLLGDMTNLHRRPVFAMVRGGSCYTFRA